MPDVKCKKPDGTFIWLDSKHAEDPIVVAMGIEVVKEHKEVPKHFPPIEDATPPADHTEKVDGRKTRHQKK